MKYTLFLDESGKFEREEAFKKRPSIVAGYLVPNQDDREPWASSLMSETKDSNENFSKIDIKNFHGMETAGNGYLPEFIACLLERLCKKKGKIYIFENESGRDVVNSDITYLTVVSEGIISLIQDLLSVNPAENIDLKVCYAVRRNVEEKNDRTEEEDLEAYLKGGNINIEKAEYEKRLNERLVLLKYRIPELLRKKISISLSGRSARTYSPLMIADAICYGYRGGINDFKGLLKDRLDRLNPILLKVNKNEVYARIKDALECNKAADAMYLWYTDFSNELMSKEDEFNRLLIGNLKYIGYKGRVQQYKILSNYLGSLVDIRSFDVANKFIDNLLSRFFVLLDENKLNDLEFLFDVKYYQLTIATHQGNLPLTSKYREECNQLLKKIEITVEKLDYYLGYRLREVECDINTFDFDNALKILDELEKLQKRVIGLYEDINQNSDIELRMGSNLLGRIYGSRLLTRAYNIKNHKCDDWYELAVADFEDAINNFQSDYDKYRIFQSRCLLECECDKLKEAYKWLARSYGQADEIPVNELIQVIKGNGFHGGNIFGLLHYVNIMWRCGWLNQPEYKAFGKELCNGLLKSLNCVEEIIDLNKEHPCGVIQWKIAAYLERMQLDNNISQKLYKSAIENFRNNKENIAVFVNVLLLHCERIGLNELGSNALQYIITDYEADLGIFNSNDDSGQIKRWLTPVINKAKEFRTKHLSWNRNKSNKVYVDEMKNRQKELLTIIRKIPVL